MRLVGLEKRIRNWLTTRPTTAIFATCPGKWWKRKARPLVNTPVKSTSSGTMCSTSLLWKERAATTTQVYNTRFLKNTTCLMKKWMSRGSPLKDNHSSRLLTRPTSWLRLWKRTRLGWKRTLRPWMKGLLSLMPSLRSMWRDSSSDNEILIHYSFNLYLGKFFLFFC